MEFTAEQIASVIGGRVEGNKDAKINTFAKIEEGVEGAISFLSNPKYTHYIYDTKSSVVIVNNDVELEHPFMPHSYVLTTHTSVLPSCSKSMKQASRRRLALLRRHTYRRLQSSARTAMWVRLHASATTPL